MNLKNLMVDTKSAWVDYPGLDGFSVHITNLSRERIVALRKNCMISKFERKSKMLIEELDEKKFISEFSKATIKNWKGLKLKYLEDLMLVDLGSNDPEQLLEYDTDNAELLLSNSGDFDRWLNDVVFDLENFRTERTTGPVESTGEIPE